MPRCNPNTPGRDLDALGHYADNGSTTDVPRGDPTNGPRGDLTEPAEKGGDCDCEALTQQSQCRVVHTAIGAALKGLPHISRLECTVEEECESARHAHEAKQAVHLATEECHWIPLSSDPE